MQRLKSEHPHQRAQGRAEAALVRVAGRGESFFPGKTLSFLLPTHTHTHTHTHTQSSGTHPICTLESPRNIFKYPCLGPHSRSIRTEFLWVALGHLYLCKAPQRLQGASRVKNHPLGFPKGRGCNPHPEDSLREVDLVLSLPFMLLTPQHRYLAWGSPSCQHLVLSWTHRAP